MGRYGVSIRRMGKGKKSLFLNFFCPLLRLQVKGPSSELRAYQRTVVWTPLTVQPPSFRLLSLNLDGRALGRFVFALHRLTIGPTVCLRRRNTLQSNNIFHEVIHYLIVSPGVQPNIRNGRGALLRSVAQLHLLPDRDVCGGFPMPSCQEDLVLPHARGSLHQSIRGTASFRHHQYRFRHHNPHTSSGLNMESQGSPQRQSWTLCNFQFWHSVSPVLLFTFGDWDSFCWAKTDNFSACVASTTRAVLFGVYGPDGPKRDSTWTYYPLNLLS